MLVLGIETSCDETAAAIVKDGCEPLGESLSSQVELHLKYGGVVPELACRGHVTFIDRVVGQVLEKSRMSLSQLDAIAVTQGPGLIGALLVGVAFAKSVAYGCHLPLVGINHLEGHLYAICLEGKKLQFPSVALVVSGGHTHLFYLPQSGKYRLIGRTLDDAAGEALDKAARVLGLGYPGGPILDRLGTGA
ncbi:MAG: tRNA (adenosine(37)-N6)-threonylcarbamoyltransferase complex transferase subunit TsaD, partial [Nitrospira sp.]|nr:tRNA (adenosine(37)-N6)-threonylcarbamoyltransferase complex transferase subunit TsaD [Nitrospira sp.]